jgi:adenine-specific DNA methylase
MSIETRFNETHTARVASREKQSQHQFRPAISVHKWFARRPGSLFRAILLAELGGKRTDASFTRANQLAGVCLDPFMGGGTPLMEANRVGLSVVGYDTNPMARWVVERELEHVDPDALAAAAERVAASAQRDLSTLYATACPNCGDDAAARYFLWVRHHRCGCGAEHPLLADTMLVSAKLGRHPVEVHCCPRCLQLSDHAPGARASCCPHCAEPFDDGLALAGRVYACMCGEPFRVPPSGTIESPTSKLVGVDYHCAQCAIPHRRSYKTADSRDHAIVRHAEHLAAQHPPGVWPDSLIRPGRETGRLLRWGFNQWRDLFSPRQLHALATVSAHISAEPDGPVRDALTTCFSGLLRYQNMLVRYDRSALKPTDVFAVHSFPVPRVWCEAHPVGLAGTGSGGFRHAAAMYVKAKRWCSKPYELAPDRATGKLARHPTVPEAVQATFARDAAELQRTRHALLRRGSLSPGVLPEKSASLVLTDPPYYDSLQYGELMDFCYAWLRHARPDVAYFETDSAVTDEDAVGSRAVGLSEFASRLSQVYVAASQALRDDGAFVFTYHHNDLEAYAPLVVACLDAGLRPSRLYACPSEMRASTHIHNRNAASVDAVFVMRKTSAEAAATEVDPARFVASRARMLRAAGVRATEADRACLRMAALAFNAVCRLADGWDRSETASLKLAAARAATERSAAEARQPAAACAY